MTSPGSENVSALLEARGLRKLYGDHEALSGLDLSIEPGDVYCLLGGNGAGKSTTIGLFLGFLVPDGGEARVAGTVVHEDPGSARKRLAYIPEQVNLYPALSGVENLSFFTELAGRGRLPTDELLAHLTGAGLPEEAAHRPVSSYSKGMRQKVGIAMALAKEADVFLLDEPTSGLDPQASNEFASMLRDLSSRGAAVLMATHDLYRTKESGTRVGILRHGNLVREFATADVDHQELEAIYLEHVRERSA